MRNIIALVERELRSYFSSPIAYVVLTLFLFLSGIVFQFILFRVLEMGFQASQGAQFGQPSTPLDMPKMVSQGFLGTMSDILLFMVPMITMALFSEEKRRGTMELLLTAPLTDAQVVLGKFFGALSFYIILLLTTLIPMGVLYLYGDPATGPIFTAYLGLLLYGLAILAIGMFISTLTENQIIAAVLTFGTIMMLWLLNVIATRAEGPITKAVLTYLSVLSHLDDFFKGVLVSSDVIFYLSLTFVALFLT